VIETRCCVVGGGPAGMMLGFLLARAGVDVVVLEKHKDFLRDFRGDTIHPSTLEIIHELGLLDQFLALPHQKVYEFQLQAGDETVTLADFSHLPTRCKFIAFLPQWDFLDFLAREAGRHSTFQLRMQTEVTDLVPGVGGVEGVRATTPEGDVEVRAELVVACDGRHSVVRQRAGLAVQEFGAPMDVLWFQISRRPGDPEQAGGRLGTGRFFVYLNRTTYWQCGYVIPKGTASHIQALGIGTFRRGVAELAPFLTERLSEIASWDDVSLLTVRVDRLRQWYRPGLLCIGDAAHAMSPVAGVGINLAIQDAVATANLLAAPLREGRVTGDHLRRVQQRRLFPTQVTQRLQLVVQSRLLGPTLQSQGRPTMPPFLRMAGRLPVLRRVLGRLVGNGVRPEHVR
jgi:2-polyprenyl-6-methoxyphenol hydroxylase-like FAD-dependent oxidoreductase